MRLDQMRAFIINLSPIVAFAITLFAMIANVIIYFMNVVWWENMGVKITLNVTETANFSIGIILFLTTIIIVAYAIIIAFTVVCFYNAFKIAEGFNLPLRTFITKIYDTCKVTFIRDIINNKINNNICLKKILNFIEDAKIVHIIGMLLAGVFPFLVLMMGVYYKSKFGKFEEYFVVGVMFYAFCILPLYLLWEPISNFIDKINLKENGELLEAEPEKNKNTAVSQHKWKTVCSIMCSIIGAAFFTTAGASFPGVAMWLIHSRLGGFEYILMAFFVGHFISFLIAYFHYDSITKKIFAPIAILVVVVMIFASWLQIVTDNVNNTKDSIIKGSQSSLQKEWILRDLMPFFRINRGNVYVENSELIKGLPNINKKFFKEKMTNLGKGVTFKDVQFLEAKDSAYIFIPLIDNKICLAEVKDGKTLKIILPVN